MRSDAAILDHIPVGIVTTDVDGVVSFVNRSARALLQLDEGWEGSHVSNLVKLDGGPRQLLGNANSRTLTYAFVAPDGTTKDIELSVSCVSQNDSLYLFVLRDAHDDREFAVERRRFDRLVAMGTMVAGFAHEVRNPVAALRSIAEELIDEHHAAGINLPHLYRMLKVLDRIERLVRTSLEFGRPATPRPARHPPSAIVAGALSIVAPRTRAHGEALRVDVEPNMPDVYCDDAQITQALVVLINNALDSVGSPSRIVVRATHERSTDRPRKSQPPPRTDAPSVLTWVLIEVIDEGPGIPPEIVGQIFDPFFTTKAEGTGLGLSIAQQIVTENRGRIAVLSPRGGPTTFTIFVPTS